MKFSELKQAGAPILRLCTLGVAIAFTLSSIAAALIFQWNWRVAALLGAILVVTGPTVVGPLLSISPVWDLGNWISVSDPFSQLSRPGGLLPQR